MKFFNQTVYQGFDDGVLFINHPEKPDKINFMITKEGVPWFGPTTYADCAAKLPEIQKMADRKLFSVVEFNDSPNKPPEISKDTCHRT